jgi:hypothetical protein
VYFLDSSPFEGEVSGGVKYLPIGTFAYQRVINHPVSDFIGVTPPLKGEESIEHIFFANFSQITKLWIKMLDK